MGRDRDEYRDVEPEKARDHGNDPDAVRINRGSGGRDRGGGREGRAASEARQGSRVRRVGATDASQGASQQQTQQQTRREEASPLRTEQRGGVRIEDTVVRKIAGLAAHEVDGVRTGGSTSQSVGGLLGSGGSSSESRGVSVEVGEVEAAVDIAATVAYGMPIPQVSEAVRRNVINRVENLVGFRVTEVNINVNDVFFPEYEQRQQ